MRQTLLATFLTVAAGLVAFAMSDQIPPKEYVFAFSNEPDPAPFTTIHGVPFSSLEGHVTITEPMAHLRLPFGPTVLGKRLVLETRFRLEGAEVFAVGIKKGDFWLDYDRHVLLDRRPSASVSSESDWIERREVFDLNRAYLDPSGALELMVFLKPEDGQRTLTMDELRIRVEPGPVNVKILAERMRRQLVRLLRRPPVISRTP
ncbi:MAG: hypothetical protein Q8R32_03595 [bacterium]|nr:hypothetical protein [bacterium]